MTETLYKLAAVPLTRSRQVDQAIRAVMGELARFTGDLGNMVRPGDSIQDAIGRAVSGDSILLMPGDHTVKSFVTVDKAVRLIGLNGTKISGSSVLMKLTAAEAEVIGVNFSTTVTGANAALRVEAARCKVDGCRVAAAGDYGIYVAAAGTEALLLGNCFDDNAAHGGSTDSDMYWENGAVNGQAVANRHSTTRAYVLDYRAVDNMSDGGNGRSAIINVR